MDQALGEKGHDLHLGLEGHGQDLEEGGQDQGHAGEGHDQDVDPTVGQDDQEADDVVDLVVGQGHIEGRDRDLLPLPS